MRRIPIQIWLALILLLAGPAPADVIRLTDGRLVQGQIVEHSESDITLVRMDTDGQVVIPWDLILERDRLALKKALGYIIETDDSLLEVDVLEVTLATGQTVRGVPVEEESTESSLVLRFLDSRATFARSDIEDTETIRMRIDEVMKPEQITAYIEEKMAPDDAESHYRTGDLLFKAGAFDSALTHFQEAATGGPTYEEYTRGKIDLCEKYIQNAEFLGRLQEIRALAGKHRFEEAVEAVDVLATDYAETGLLEDPEALKAEIEQQRQEYFTRAVAREYFRLMPSLVGRLISGKLEEWEERAVEGSGPGAQVRAEKPSLADARSFVQSQLHAALKKRIAEGLEIPEEEVQVFWDARSGGSRRVSYGSGTFIVDMRGRSITRSNRPGRGSSSSGGSIRERLRGNTTSGSSSGKESKLGDPEAWWEAADSSTRRSWLLAYFVEATFPPERIVRVDYRTCDTCSGAGTVTVYAVAGAGAQQKICSRCQGPGADRIVVYE